MIIEIIANTPKWVWLILIALTVYGKYLSKDQLVHEKMLFILPFVMIYMGLSGISSAFSETLLASTIWLSGIVLSCTLLYFLKLHFIFSFPFVALSASYVFISISLFSIFTLF